jgi:hypothetical protein
MKTIKIIALITGVIFSVAVTTAFVGWKKTPVNVDPTTANGNGFAVLELFTSEGCSSCPPADELAAKIQAESKGKPVYILAYHVDYWDRLGWKDTFSHADYSKRQAQYASWLSLRQIYTPQLIINGKDQFVGSDEPEIRKSISTQLSGGSKANLKIDANLENSALKVNYFATGAFENSNVLIALAQKSAQNKISNGENAGRSLSHIQIVRKLQVQQLNRSGNGNLVIDLPKGFNAKNSEILGLVQNKNTGEILSAAKVDSIGVKLIQ